jgi:hypothetical protein
MESPSIFPQNPYNADYGDDVSTAPFAGRQAAFAKLYQHLSKQDRTNALLFLGRRHIGKTALLRAFDRVFSDTHLPAYVPLKETPLENELDWFLALAGAATESLIDRGYTISRMVNVNPPDGDARAWFTGEFLPPMLGAIRYTRRLVFLLDDADQLLDAIRAERLPADTLEYAAYLLKTYSQIDIVLTLDTEHEADIPALAPLINVNEVSRLNNLSLDEAKWLLSAPVDEHYQVDDAASAAAMRTTGGTPGLLQQFGYLMFRKWSNDPSYTQMTADDVKGMIATVYSYSERDYRELWQALSAEERLTLTAISAINYQDPIGRVDAAAIEAWLVETDYPLDVIAINAALRGLEYRETAQITPQGIKIKAELLQMWLLEHARVGERRRTPSQPAAPRENRNRLSQRINDMPGPSGRDTGKTKEKPRPYQAGTVRLILLFALALLISTAILIISLTSPPRDADPNALDPQATVTLVSNP